MPLFLKRVTSKPMALLVFKFLRLKAVFSFVIFLKIEELEFHLLRMARTLGCLSHSSGMRLFAVFIKTAFTYSGRQIARLLIIDLVIEFPGCWV